MLLTNFVRIGLSGKTTDGRTIKPEWLEQAAKNYNTDTYTARINYEHKTWAGNYGLVAELKTEKENGKTALYAKIRPNADLLHLNRQGEKLFTSMELRTKFADVKGAYLKGLAVTDDPASLGTQELRFSSDQTPQILVSEAVEMENFTECTDDEPEETPEVEADKAISMFKALAKKLKVKVTDSKDDENDDYKEALTLFGEIKTALENFSTPDITQLFSKESGEALQENYTAIKAEYDKMANRVNELEIKLSESLEEVPTKEPKEHNASADDKPKCW